MSQVPTIHFDNDPEGSIELLDALNGLEATLMPLLEEERDRLQKQAEYLREVHDGITGGAPLEFSSTIFADIFLLASIGRAVGS